MKGLIKNNITLAKRFNFTTRYIDDVLTLNNSRFVTEIQHIYPSELYTLRGRQRILLRFLT